MRFAGGNGSARLALCAAPGGKRTSCGRFLAHFLLYLPWTGIVTGHIATARGGTDRTSPDTGGGLGEKRMAGGTRFALQNAFAPLFCCRYGGATSCLHVRAAFHSVRHALSSGSYACAAFFCLFLFSPRLLSFFCTLLFYMPFAAACGLVARQHRPAR